MDKVPSLAYPGAYSRLQRYSKNNIGREELFVPKRPRKLNSYRGFTSQTVMERVPDISYSHSCKRLRQFRNNEIDQKELFAPLRRLKKEEELTEKQAKTLLVFEKLGDADDKISARLGR